MPAAAGDTVAVRVTRWPSSTVPDGAEGSTFIAELMDGKRSRHDYAALAGQQYFVYEALERVADTLMDDPVVAPFAAPELARLAEIDADLQFLVGADWRASVVALPATLRYAERIRETAEWPGGFLAHHYTRYLGDLSGGQIIRTLLQRQFGFDADGVRFYRFAGIPKSKPFKDAYRAKLDSVPLSAEERERVVDEVASAFDLNAAMFADLERATTGQFSG